MRDLLRAVVGASLGWLLARRVLAQGRRKAGRRDLVEIVAPTSTSEAEVEWSDPQTRSGGLHEGPVRRFELIFDEGEAFEPVDLTPYIARTLWDHAATPRVGEGELETIPDGCWRTVSALDGRYVPCNRTAASDLGLCADHRDELAAVGPEQAAQP